MYNIYQTALRATPPPCLDHWFIHSYFSCTVSCTPCHCTRSHVSFGPDQNPALNGQRYADAGVARVRLSPWHARMYVAFSHPKTSIWGVLGGSWGWFGDLGAHFSDLEWPGTPLYGQRRKLHRFTSTIGTRRVPFGDHLGVILVTFSEFLVLKWEVRLRTPFLMQFGWQRDRKTVA